MVFKKARAMVCSELKDLNYSAIIARKLATVHHLNVPINKDPTWLLDTLDKWLVKVREYKQQQQQDSETSALEQELIEFDFESEIKRLATILAQCESPIVFSHNDLQEGNILIPSDKNITKLLNSNQMNVQQFEDHIVFIDFEFCSYNYRGFDLGNHFCERMFDYSNPEWPHYYANLDEYPSHEAKLYFVAEYLKQSKELKFDPNTDTEEHLIKEADFYTLGSHLLWTLWSINNARASQISFGYWVMDFHLRKEKFHQTNPIFCSCCRSTAKLVLAHITSISSTWWTLTTSMFRPQGTNSSHSTDTSSVSGTNQPTPPKPEPETTQTHTHTSCDISTHIIYFYKNAIFVFLHPCII